MVLPLTLIKVPEMCQSFLVHISTQTQHLVYRLLATNDFLTSASLLTHSSKQNHSTSTRLVRSVQLLSPMMLYQIHFPESCHVLALFHSTQHTINTYYNSFQSATWERAQGGVRMHIETSVSIYRQQKKLCHQLQVAISKRFLLPHIQLVRIPQHSFVHIVCL